MEKFNVTQKKSDIVEISLAKAPEAFIKLQLVNPQEYCAIHTFVPPELRGHGMGKKLYDCMVKYVRDQKATFSATCPFIVDIANNSKEVKDIYKKPQV